MTLANNHFYDYVMEGMQVSLRLFEKEGIKYVGAGENLAEAQKTLFLERDKERVAIINCCEHEFSIATTNEGGCNPLNPIQQYYAIRDAREKADYVVVIVHGGHEHY